jgi:CRISPR-associated endonuclease/helicase Cas3
MIRLFHARFTVQDRMDIEASVKKIFGKESSDQERQGQLLIATQVVEQSLDLDFDCMVTDLAPIDLMIQRAGRLQRHSREDSKRPDPVLRIYGPLPTDDVQENWYSEIFEKGQYVYADHSQLWIGAKLLADKKRMSMPDDARMLIESVYSDEGDLTAPACLQAKADKQQGKDRANQDLANFVQLKLDGGYCRDAQSSPWPVDLSHSCRISTRLSEIETHLIYLARYEQNKFSPWHDVIDMPTHLNDKEKWQLSSLTIATHHLKECSPIKENFNMSELLDQLRDQLPDKGKYSSVLIFNAERSRWYLFNEEKLLDALNIRYETESGLLMD